MRPNGLILALLTVVPTMVPAVAMAHREPTVVVQTPRAATTRLATPPIVPPLAPSVTVQRPLEPTVSHPGGTAAASGRKALRAFKMLDANLDGRLDRRELPNLPQVRGHLFTLLDRNDDGRLMRPDFGRNHRAAELVAANGGIGSEQFAKAPPIPPLYVALDANHDGFLAANEFRPTLPGARQPPAAPPAVRHAPPPPARPNDCWIPLVFHDGGDQDGELGLLAPVTGTCGLRR